MSAVKSAKTGKTAMARAKQSVSKSVTATGGAKAKKANKKEANSNPAATHTCPICLEPIIDAGGEEEGQEALYCEGTCECWHHRWCAGVTKQRFETISASPEPFFCPSCKSERQQDAIVRLKLCVDSLCEEVRVLKGTVETLLKQTPAPVAAAKDVSCKDGAKWNVVAGKKKSTKKKGQHANTGEHSISKQDQKLNGREKVQGVRRVWGTLRACTAPSVKNVVERLTNIGSNIHVKRKFRTTNNRTRWWFLIHADERVLSELENQWDKVALQTTWKLETCTKPREESPTGPESLPEHNLFSKNSTPALPSTPTVKQKESPLDVHLSHLSPQEEEEAPPNPNTPTCTMSAPVQRPLLCYLDSQEA